VCDVLRVPRPFDTLHSQPVEGHRSPDGLARAQACQGPAAGGDYPGLDSSWGYNLRGRV
jgi:hypothetical protein